MPYAAVLRICSYSFLCTGHIHHLSNSSSHSVSYKTVQVLCLMLSISQVAYSAHVCGIISGTVQGWNQWYSRLQDGFCIISHPQDAHFKLIYVSSSINFRHITTTMCNLFMFFLFLCYYKAIQVKLYE